MTYTTETEVADASLTLEKLAATVREFEMAQMDREMEILLQDNGPAVLSLLHGGQLIVVNGHYYVVRRDVLAFTRRDWR